MLGLLDRPDAPLGNRTEALQRRTMLVGWFGVLLALAAAFGLLRSLMVIWDWVQRALGSDSPAFHMPHASGGTGLAWLALALLAAAVFGLSTGRLRRRYAWLSLALVPAIAAVDWLNCGADTNPIFVAPSRIERAILSGDLVRADVLVNESSSQRPAPDLAYIRAQIALRNHDRVQVQKLMQPFRDPLDHFVYRVSRDPTDNYGFRQNYGDFRPQVLYEMDRLVYGRPVSGIALEYERRHPPLRGWRGVLSSATPIFVTSALALLAWLTLRMWRTMRANYLSVLDHQNG